MLYDEHYDDYPDSFLVRMNRREGQHLRARVPARAAIDRVLGFWLRHNLTSLPHLFILQGPKGELEFTFPPPWS